MRHPLNQVGPNPTSYARCESSEKLFSCIQLGSFTPDEVIIDPGAVPRTAALAHMLRTSLKTAISCLTSDMADVSPSSNNRACRLHHITLYHNKHVYDSIKELHLRNLHCPLNCLDGRYLALHHHWHIDDSINDTLRDTFLGG